MQVSVINNSDTNKELEKSVVSVVREVICLIPSPGAG